ncbi:MAG: DUF1343 domain-containing protein [Labilithrix sp.]|nr:DUF1343 domain-containing protein [Labilithrix sp.]MBX3219261.1 DUF1343 domain-containing protein [Labilithrix sp.]
MTSVPAFGLDRLSSDPSLAPLVAELREARVALLAHPASVTRDLVHALDVLRGLGIAPRVLFGPEHGWAGHAQDMIGVGDGAEAGARVVSLYGERYEDLSPRPEHLDGIDVVVIDLQDVGARYYTFVWTAVLVARACRDAGVRVVVLDRPNPLGGEVIEGRLQDERFKSFVGLELAPIRHGLTLGEIVAWRAKAEGYEDIVTVVRVAGLERAAHAPAWGRAFVMPSPNMPTYDTALVYPGGCLLEGTNLSDGRGTTRPFELTGAPWVDGARLARGLAATGLPGFIARATSFEPTFHKHGRQTCGGVQIHVTDASAFRPVATYVALVALAHHAHPEHFRFRTEKYEFVDDIPAFDLLTGSAVCRERILARDDARDVAEQASAIGDAERAVVAEARAARVRSF